MTTYHDMPSLLRVAETLEGDPAVDDLGPLFAAAARHSAVSMGRQVYGSHHLMAASLLHTLARLDCLEHSTTQFAWVAAASFLEANSYVLKYKLDDAVDLAGQAARSEVKVREISSALHGWTVN